MTIGTDVVPTKAYSLQPRNQKRDSLAGQKVL